MDSRGGCEEQLTLQLQHVQYFSVWLQIVSLRVTELLFRLEQPDFIAITKFQCDIWELSYHLIG